jgi:AraC family transcriptional regulator of arabinose operon
MQKARCRYSGEPNRDASFGIAALAVRERMPPIVVDRPRGWDDYLFILFDDAVPILLNGRMTTCRASSLVIWAPNARHFFGDTKHPWSHTWMYGNGRKAAALVAASGLPLETPIAISQPRVTERYFFQMYNEVHRHAQPDDVILEALLTAWLREVRRDTRGHAPGGVIPDQLLPVVDAMQRDPAAELPLPEMARMAALSVSQFSHVFRKHLGTSPIDYLLSLRLQRAIYHLADHNLNMTEIARKVGFNDPLYFSKQFKKRFSKSPMQYRKQMGTR